MKKTIKAATLALTLAVVSPTFLYAAPRTPADCSDTDNPIVRAVKKIKKVIVQALEGPMIPPPAQH
jgi:hypothetical protein